MSDYEDYSDDYSYDSNNDPDDSDDLATLISNKFYEAEDFKDNKQYDEAISSHNEVIE